METRSNLRPELRLKLAVTHMAMQDHYHSPPSASATAREDLAICIINNETSTFNCHPSDITPKTHAPQWEEGVSFLGEEE